jgi:hypothetical protein
MVTRIVVLSTVVAVLVWGQAVPAAADSGFTSNDFKLTHVVADIGATAMVTAEGTMDRDLYFVDSSGHIGFSVEPSFDLQQTCMSLITPTETIVATRTANYPFASFVSTVVVPPGQHGRYLDWTVTVFYDPALDRFISFTGICPSGYVPLGWTIYCPPDCNTVPPTVTGMRLSIWPGLQGISPRLTRQGELLWIRLTFSSGHTEY